MNTLGYMEQLFIVAIFTTLVFVILKMIEMKYLEDEMKPLKYVFRDAVMVFSSALGAAVFTFYIKGSLSDFLNIVTENKVLQPEATQIFTDSPGF